MDLNLDTLVQAGLGGAAIVMVRQLKEVMKTGFKSVNAILTAHGQMLQSHHEAITSLMMEGEAPPQQLIGFAVDPQVDDPEDEDDA